MKLDKEGLFNKNSRCAVLNRLYFLEVVQVDKVRINQNTIFTKTELHFTNITNQFLNLRFSFSKIILISVNKMVIYVSIQVHDI